MIGKEG